LALRNGAALVPVVCLPRPDGGYSVHYLPELTVTSQSTVEEITQACWDALEPSLHDHPELWLWSYKHWRYRPEGSLGNGYPFYANSNEEFQRLIKNLP
jgi:lauroyl/myristoyl acyltransferase